MSAVTMCQDGEEPIVPENEGRHVTKGDEGEAERGIVS